MTVRRSFGPAAVLALLATGAWAECPSRVDDVRGVVLTRTEPFISSWYRATPTGLSEVRVLERDGNSEKVTATYLHALAPLDRVSAKNTIALRYVEPVEGLNDLESQKVWRSAVTVLIDGSPAMEGSATMTFVRTEEVAVGGCSYPTWVVEDRLSLGDDNGTYFVQYYAPDLGLIVRSVKVGADGTPISAVAFDTIEMGEN